MFNSSFDLVEYIKEFRSLALKKAAFKTIAGSVSYTLVSAADRTAVNLMRDGLTVEDCKTLSVKEARALLSGPETGPSNDEMKRLTALYHFNNEVLGQAERFTLTATKKLDEQGRAEYGTMKAALQSMTGPQREREIARQQIEMAKAAGFTFTSEDIKEAQKIDQQRAQFYADQKAKRSGLIEWCLDKLFASVPDCDDLGAFTNLDLDTREILANKLMAWMQRQVARRGPIEMNILTNRRGDDILLVSEKILLDAAIRELPDLMYASATKKAVAEAKAKRVSKPAKPKVQRAPAPVADTTVVSEVNGIKVTTSA